MDSVKIVAVCHQLTLADMILAVTVATIVMQEKAVPKVCWTNLLAKFMREKLNLSLNIDRKAQITFKFSNNFKKATKRQGVSLPDAKQK